MNKNINTFTFNTQSDTFLSLSLSLNLLHSLYLYSVSILSLYTQSLHSLNMLLSAITYFTAHFLRFNLIHYSYTSL